MRVAASSISGRARQQAGNISPVKWLRARETFWANRSISLTVRLNVTSPTSQIFSCGRLGSVAVPKTSTSVSGVFAAGSQQLLHHKIDIHRRIGRYRTCPGIAIQHAC